MKTLLIVTLFIIVNTIIGFGQDDNYRDSLKVNILSGIRLRFEPSTMSMTKRILNYGEYVKKIQIMANEDKLDDLFGKWIKVIVSYDTGYVFDAYLSDLPSISTCESKSKDLIPLITNYVFNDLDIIDSIHYNSCFGLEGYHDMKIYNLDKGHQFIRNVYNESYGIELQLKGVNYNEGLCMIKNFLELSKAQEVVYTVQETMTYIETKSGENCCGMRVGVCEDKCIISIWGGP